MSDRSAKALAICAALAMVLAAAAVAAAQESVTEERGLITKSEIAINWMKSVLRSQGKELEAARRSKDTKTINCIEDRIVEIQSAITDSEKALERLKDFAFRKSLGQAKQEFDRIERNRKKVEEQLELINKCREMIGTGKSFTEVTEEYLGSATDQDPTSDKPPSDPSVPIPPGFESTEEPPTADEPGEGDDDEG